MPTSAQGTHFSRSTLFLGLSIGLHVILIYSWNFPKNRQFPVQSTSMAKLKIQLGTMTSKEKAIVPERQVANSPPPNPPEKPPTVNTNKKPARITEKVSPPPPKPELSLQLDNPVEFLQPIEPANKTTVFNPILQHQINQYRGLFTLLEHQDLQTHDENDLVDDFGRRRIVVDGRCWLIPDEMDDIQTGFPLVAQDLSCEQVKNKAELQRLVDQVLGR